jgi:hypothetical protein
MDICRVVHVLVHTSLNVFNFSRLRNVFKSRSLRRHADMAVVFHHSPAQKARNRHDRLFAHLALGQLRDAGVPQIF